jgi:hypothetical protein
MRTIAATTLLVLALSSGVASATPPERHVLSYDDTFTTTDVCGFRISLRWIGTGYGTVFFDRNGDFMRQMDRIRERLIVTNVSTGESVSGHNAYQLAGTEKTLARTGAWFHVRGRGIGIVLRDVGRTVVTWDGDVIAVAGGHQWLEGDFDALCRALAT